MIVETTTLRNLIAASFTKQEDIQSQKITKNEDLCLQYINKTKNLLTFLVNEMDEEVISCLQSEACSLSCQSYENELMELLAFINNSIIDTNRREFQKLIDYIDIAINDPPYKQSSRSQLKSNECESNSYNNEECDIIYTDYLKYNEILDPEEIKPEGLTFAYEERLKNAYFVTSAYA